LSSRPSRPPPFPSTTLFRSEAALLRRDHHPARRLVPAERSSVLRIVLWREVERHAEVFAPAVELERVIRPARLRPSTQRHAAGADRKSTRLNSSHQISSYAV